MFIMRTVSNSEAGLMGGWPNPRAQGIRHYCLIPDAAAHGRCLLSSTGLFGFKSISTILDNAPAVTVNRWAIGVCGFWGQPFLTRPSSGEGSIAASINMDMLVAWEDSTTLPPDRPVPRLLVVRGLAALGLAAPLWPSWHGCTLWNEVPASVARGIIAALKPDHHVKVAALVSMTKNKPLKHVSIQWSSQFPLTAGQLQRKREEFWDTAPAFEGRIEIWNALKAAADFLERNDYEMAQAILDAMIPSRCIDLIPPERNKSGNAARLPSLARGSRDAVIRFEPQTFRGVSLPPAVRKLLTSFILRHLTVSRETLTRENQAGFRLVTSSHPICTDDPQSWCSLTSRVLLTVLAPQDMPQKFVNIIRSLLSHTLACERVC
ncbi:hypothetical protein T265_05814 [Opisthorchis viverrini]|uniref:DC-UbP/UBTD2 N-terminal domain-containing protein n=1 Tax=Opisthorchis viverrini TaxID=6198 RepID=A0A074ZIA3_OPIVI|nr:hypothetical protein T265_05814 [Opisthorchis viverrini]KER27048.1 hypothetical protein T265_05814 [Opisthorchis viverrini]